MSVRICVAVDVGPDDAKQPSDFYVNDVVYFSGSTLSEALFCAGDFLEDKAKKLTDRSEEEYEREYAEARDARGSHE